MKMCATHTIWNRSMEYKIRYTTILPNEDAKTYKNLTKNCIYSPDVPINKEG